MPIGLYADAHVPRAIATELRRLGVDLINAQEDESDALPDPQLLDRATALGRVIVTFDSDFLVEAALRQREKAKQFTGVIFVRARDITYGQCVSELQLLALLAEPAECADRVIFVPL